MYLFRRILKVSLFETRYRKCSLAEYSIDSKKNVLPDLPHYDFDLKVNDIHLTKFIKSIVQEFHHLSHSETLGNIEHQRLAQLQPVIKVLKERSSILENLSALKEMLKEKDAELQKMAQDEISTLQEKIKSADEDLINVLIPADQYDSCNSIVLEVNAGVGGQEAMLFAKELFDMYCNFAEYKGWEVIVANYDTSDLGGVRHASALIEGRSSFQFFKYEAGVHRVQRIPSTEKGGRIHTSTASVIALPQPTDIEVNINPKDLKIETKRASGAGGQHVNTTDSAVRILHIPTNISVECQVDRSQIKNKQIAMTKLRAMLYQKELESQIEKSEKTRKSQVRSNFRNEKIRTYNFSQDRISDHRLQGCQLHNIKVFLEGGKELDSLISRLHNHFRIQCLLEAVNNIENKDS